MRIELASTIVAISAAAICACSSVDVGRPEPDPNPPKLVKILIMDEGNFRVVDLLNPPQAAVACSEIDPCTPLFGIYDPNNGVILPWPSCRTAEGTEPAANETGTCVDPTVYDAATHPAPIVDAGANIISLVFSEPFSTSVTEAFEGETGSSIVTLTGPGGEESTSRVYFPSGSPVFSTELFFEPYGPSLTLRPDGPYFAGATYTISIDTSKLPAPDGNAQSNPSYTFVTEGLAMLEAIPDTVTASTTEIVPNDVVQFRFNAAVDEAATASTAEARDAGGNRVTVALWLDRGGDPAACGDNLNPNLVDVVRTSSTGTPIDWAEGVYTLTFDAKAMHSDSKTTVEATFTVAGDRAEPGDDPAAYENFVLPGMCE